jgi:5-methyltetrahydrofolate--homocysteine methyltransferase
MKFHDLLKKDGVVFFDGSMGTRLQSLGLAPGACPEEISRSRPEMVLTVHREYVEAGAQVILTNTFGANRKKLGAYGLEKEVADLTVRAVQLARKACDDRAVVALSLGPTGAFVEPVGSMSFAEIRDIFAETVSAARGAGVDLVVVETMSDIQEVRAAAVAVKDAGLPLVVTMTFEEDGRTVLGTPPEVAAAVAGALGAVMMGANCSLGPRELYPIAETLVRESTVPVLVQPNAGLPQLDGGTTVFPTGPGEFASEAERFIALGVRGIGGCCGTTPDHIRALRSSLKNRRPPAVLSGGGSVLASRVTALHCGPGFPLRIVGERINPTGKKKLSAEISAGATDIVREEALGQVAAGADLLDINVGVPGLVEAELLPKIIGLVQNVVGCPLVIDSADPAALEAALHRTPGKPLLNSVNGKEESLERVLPLARRYGAAVLGLPLDKKGVPETAPARLALVRRILEAAEGCGLRREDLIIDGLTLAAGADQRQPAEILDTIRRIRDELGLTTILGVSNISFGLPARAVMNASFLSMAAAAGLDMAIVNPYEEILMGSARAADVLLGRDAGAKRYLSLAGGDSTVSTTGAGSRKGRSLEEQIGEAVVTGDRGAIAALVEQALDSGMEPMTISNQLLIPALEEVGDRYGKKVFFLPQVIGAAEAAKAAFEVLKERAPLEEGPEKESVLLASVEGDIHDIGKNIVSTLLENHGYRLIDLGTNVSPARIVDEARRHRPRAIGLSALMTTTLPAMEATIAALREAGIDAPIVVGGAVVTEEYARRIGSTAYAADALDAVRIVTRLIGKGPD